LDFVPALACKIFFEFIQGMPARRPAGAPARGATAAHGEALGHGGSAFMAPQPGFATWLQIPADAQKEYQLPAANQNPAAPNSAPRTFPATRFNLGLAAPILPTYFRIHIRVTAAQRPATDCILVLGRQTASDANLDAHHRRR